MATTSVDQVTGYGETVAYKAPCRLATTANIVLSGLQAIDGSMTVARDRVLVKNQTDASQNGIWIAATSAWVRAVDMDSNRDVTTGTQVLVWDGATNAGPWYIETEGPISIGTTPLVFAFSFDQAGVDAIIQEAVALAEAWAIQPTDVTPGNPSAKTSATAAAANAVLTAADRVATAADVVTTATTLTSAQAARDAALYGKGIFPTTAAAIGLGVIGHGAITPGATGTDGTFALAFTGGTGSGAAGRFVVAGGILTGIFITAPGSYTVAPTFSFAASAGLAGAASAVVLGVNVDVGEYFWAPISTTGLGLYQVAAGPVAVDTGIRQAVGLNLWPDPFAEQLEEFPWVRLSSSLYVGTYTGTINKPSTYAGFGKTGIMTASGVIANRRISLAEIGAAVGDTFSFAMAANFVGATNTMQVVFLNSAGGAVAGTLALLTSGTAGYKDLYGSAPIPATTVAIELRAFSSTNTTELLAVACAKGDVRPLYIAAPAPPSSSLRSGTQKLNADPFFRLAALGYNTDPGGNFLAGVTIGGARSFVAAPATSPFASKAISLAVGVTIWDVKASAAELGLKVGEPIHVIVDVEGAQSVQAIATIAVSSGVAHNESNTVNPAVAGGLGYKSIGLTITPTQNDVTFATYLTLRLSISGGVVASGFRVLGWSIQKAKSRLTYTEGPLQSAWMTAADAHPKLNYDPFLRKAAAGQTIDQQGNLLIGATAGGFPAVLSNPPVGAPFKTKAIKIPAGATLHQVFGDTKETGLTLGETVWCNFAFWTGSAQSINFLHQLLVTAGVALTGQITTVVNGLEYFSLPIVIDQNAIDNGYTHMFRTVPSGAFAADAYLLGWAIQKAPGKLVDNHGQFDLLGATVATVTPSPFAGLNQVTIGDSFAAEGTYVPPVHSGPGTVPIMAQRTGWVSTNCALGGTRWGAHAANWNEFSGYKLADIIAGGSTAALIAAGTAIGGSAPTVAARIAAVDWADQDYLHAAFGLNDYSGTGPQVPIGINTDFTGATFKGAMRYFIETVLTAHPSLKLYFTTMCWRFNEVALQQTAPAIAYVDATIEICDLYNIPCMDMYHSTNFNNFTYQEHFDAGGGHLIDFGQRNFGNIWANGAFQLLG